MKKIMIYTLLVLLVFIVVAVLISLANPLAKSQEEIRENILKLTPIGTSMDDVVKIIENNKKWETMYVNDKNGYSIMGGIPSEASSNEVDTVVGKKSIRVMIGKYHFQPQFDIYAFIERYVNVFWAFDENSKLIEVSVRKDASGF